MASDAARVLQEKAHSEYWIVKPAYPFELSIEWLEGVQWEQNPRWSTESIQTWNRIIQIQIRSEV
jgi:hypothetical protein